MEPSHFERCIIDTKDFEVLAGECDLIESTVNETEPSIPNSGEAWYEAGYNFQQAALYPIIYQNEATFNHFGKYSEDFQDDNGQGWSRGGNFDVNSSTANNEFRIYYNGSSAGHYTYIYSPTFELTATGEEWSQVKFDMRTDWRNSNDYDLRVYYEVNETGVWNQFVHEGSVHELAYHHLQHSSTGSIGGNHQV